LIDPDSSRDNEVAQPALVRWRVPEGQYFVFADFEDGILMFDSRIGSTHLLNATAAEALSVVQRTPGIVTEDVYRAVLERLDLVGTALPLDALIDLLWQLENLGLVVATE
jgi:PqqD family protein of HPr-rel-A system